MVSTYLANPDYLVYGALSDLLKPPPPIDYNQWAVDNIVFGESEAGSFAGPYNPDLFPFFTEILTALSPECACSTVTLMKSAQIGGTVTANIFTLGTLDMMPCQFLYVHPTEGNAAKWSKGKLNPMLRENTRLAQIFPMSPRDGGNSVTYKERRDGRGSISICGANSPASLSQTSNRAIAMDDLAKWENNDAGDPEGQAESRASAFEDAKIFKISTPLWQTESGADRITENFYKGSQEHYHIPCPHCKVKQKLEWENIKKSIEDEHIENPFFTCIQCGGIIEEHHRANMVKQGEWVADNPKMINIHRSFHIWSAYAPLMSWGRLARYWINAKGKIESEKVFLNDRVGLPYKMASNSVKWESLRDRAEASEFPRSIVPYGYPIVTIGVDVQGDYLEWVAVAYGTHSRRFFIDHGVIDGRGKFGQEQSTGHISDPNVRKELNALVTRKFKTQTGSEIEVDMLDIDAGNWINDVFDWVKSKPASKVIMSKGGKKQHDPRIKAFKEDYKESGIKKKYGRRGYWLNVHEMKMTLFNSLPETNPEKMGYIGFAAGLGDNFFEQLVSEDLTEFQDRYGSKFYRYVPRSGVRNEVLDCVNYSQGAAEKLGIRSFTLEQWNQLIAERFQSPPEPQLDFEAISVVDKDSNAENVNKITSNVVKKAPKLWEI